jgi:hypothetical protein
MWFIIIIMWNIIFMRLEIKLQFSVNEEALDLNVGKLLYNRIIIFETLRPTQQIIKSHRLRNSGPLYIYLPLPLLIYRVSTK